MTGNGVLRTGLAREHEHPHLAGVRQAELPAIGPPAWISASPARATLERGAGDPDLLPRSEPRAELHVSGHLQERAHRVHAERQALHVRAKPAAGHAVLPPPPSKNFSTNVNDEFDPTLPSSLATPKGHNVAIDVNTKGWGFGAQYSYLGNLGALPNQLTIGASLDAGRTDFTQSDQEANFASDRSSIPVGGFVMETQARTTNQYWGSISPIRCRRQRGWMSRWLAATTGPRRKSRILRDQSGADGDHRFNRFNPAVGVTFKPWPVLTAYVATTRACESPRRSS